MNQKTIFTHLGKVVVKDSNTCLDLSINQLSDEHIVLSYNKQTGRLYFKDENLINRMPKTQLINTLLELSEYSEQLGEYKDFSTIIRHLDFRREKKEDGIYEVLRDAKICDNLKNPSFILNAPYLIAGSCFETIVFNKIVPGYRSVKGLDDLGITLFEIPGPILFRKVIVNGKLEVKMSNGRNDYFFASKHDWETPDLIIKDKSEIGKYFLRNNLN